jgi:hypothetical protein
MSENKFPKGLYFNKHEKAPDFVLGQISIAVDQFIDYLQQNYQPTDKARFQVKRSKEGKIYCEVDTWQPNGERSEPKQQAPQPQSQYQPQQMQLTDDDDLPF